MSNQMKNILKISFSKTFEANLNTKDTFLTCEAFLTRNIKDQMQLAAFRTFVPAPVK